MNVKAGWKQIAVISVDDALYLIPETCILKSYSTTLTSFVNLNFFNSAPLIQAE